MEFSVIVSIITESSYTHSLSVPLDAFLEAYYCNTPHDMHKNKQTAMRGGELTKHTVFLLCLREHRVIALP